MNEKPKQNRTLGNNTGPVMIHDGLHTLRQVQREMAACYRAAQHGAISTQDLVTLIYALSQLAKVIEINDLERRMDALQGIAETSDWTH